MGGLELLLALALILAVAAFFPRLADKKLEIVALIFVIVYLLVKTGS